MIRRYKTLLLSAWFGVCLVAGTEPARTQEIRYFERDGITYREVLGVPPVAQITQNPQCAPIVYRPQIYIENRAIVRTYWLPVTEYRWETRWVNRWNPFAEPYQELRYVPVTRWEYRTEVVEVPVACQRWVAESAPAGTATYAAAYPGSSVVAVAGLPAPYAPRARGDGQSTTSQPWPNAWQASNAKPASLAGNRTSEPTPAVAWRLPLRPPSAPTSVRMIPVLGPDWSRGPNIGGIRRFEDEPLRGSR